MAGADPRAQLAEERAAAALDTPDTYRALLQRRLDERPVLLDVGLLEETVAAKPWQDALRPFACRVLGYPPVPPDAVVLLNTFHRVPTMPLEMALVRGLGLRRGSVHSAAGGRNLTLDRMTALQEFRPRSLVRAHVIATPRTRAMLALLGIRPILLVRDIFDTIASYADDRTDPRIGTGYRLAALDPMLRRRILVLRMASELVDFYASWIAEQRIGRCSLHRWEDVRLDWPGFIADRLAEFGRSVARAELEAMIASLPPDPHAQTGRGATLADEDRALVRSLYAQYPAVDFRPIDGGAMPAA